MAESAQRQDVVEPACQAGAAAWAELGCTSAVQCCKLVSMVRRQGYHARLLQPSQCGRRTAARGSTRLPSATSTKRVAKHFTSGMNARSPDGGAEHNITWVLAIANANTNPVEVKQHCLRSSAYNVIDLLVLTFDVTY